MRSSNFIKLALFSLCVVVLTGCLTNPITGNIGPSWTVPMGAPLASNTVYLSDVINDQFETRDDLYVFYQEADFSINLAEYVRFDFAEDIDSGIEFTIPGEEIKVEISLADLNMNLDDIDQFQSIGFAQGTLAITFPNDPDWHTDSITIDGKPLAVADNNLAGQVINNDSKIAIVASSDAPNPNLPNTARISFSNTELASFKGCLHTIEISADDFNLDLNLDLELPEAVESALSGVEWLDASLFLTINNKTNLPINMEQLKINFIGASGSSYLSFTDKGENGAIITKEGTKTTYTFKPTKGKEHPIISAIQSIPDAIKLEGSIVVGQDDQDDSVDLQFADLEVVVGFDLASQITFNVDQVESIIVGPFDVQPDEDLADNIEEFIESAYLYARVTNNFPLGVGLVLELSESEDNWENATQISIGDMPKGEESTLVFPVEQPLIDLIRNGGYTRVQVTLLGTGSQDYAIRASDYLKFALWAEVRVKINH